MGKEPHPWQFRNLDYERQQLNASSVMFPAFANPYGLSVPRFHQLNSAAFPTSSPVNGSSVFNSAQKRFLVFDQSGDQTSLIFSSLGTQFPNGKPNNQGLELPRSDETNVTNDIVNGSEEEEMHEDTEEIDALLYSDSDNEEEEEEEASTGHSPIEMTGGSTGEEEEEVASSSLLRPPPPPAKRRRVESELDPSLADTASSTHYGGNSEERKKVKRERIQETVGVLRRIIPGGKGKDAAAVLDEAIRYLRSLRLKAKGLGVANL